MNAGRRRLGIRDKDRIGREKRVAQRSGFTREAVLRSFMRGKGERQDMVAFGLLRDEL